MNKPLNSVDSSVQLKALLDPSLWFLLLSNAITIILALTYNWSLAMLMWIYWFQSIAIGVTNFIRILQLKDFSTKDFKFNGHPVQPTKDTKNFTAFFFAAHYGFFHFGYMVFLLQGDLTGPGDPGMTRGDWAFVILVSAIFFANHIFSYFHNRSQDNKKLNIGKVMFYPYARVLPMHLMVFLGGFVPVFLGLKTAADVIMHVTEHRIFLGTKE